MKALADGTEVAARTYYYLLDWNEVNYTYMAYRDSGKPSFIDYEMIPFFKKVEPRLEIIFDAFDEICYRLKDKE